MTALTSEASFNLALDTAKRRLTSELPRELVAILGLGGVARAEFVPRWSDLDLLVIVDSITPTLQQRLGYLRRTFNNDNAVRLDIILHSRREIAASFTARPLVGSLVLNALSGRPLTGKVLYGNIELRPLHFEIEREAALHYVSHTTHRLRKLLLDAFAGDCSEIDALARSIRWMSSLSRCILRSERVFTPPYEPMLARLQELFPLLDLGPLAQAFAARKEWPDITSPLAHHLLRDLSFLLERLLVSHATNFNSSATPPK